MAVEPKLGSKIFYKIGEVSEIAKVPPYVLRFWESQFSFLRPQKSRGNQRLYLQRDIEIVLEIKRMLYEEGYTIAGLQRFWARRTRYGKRKTDPRDLVKRIRGDLHAILKVLESYDS